MHAPTDPHLPFRLLFEVSWEVAHKVGGIHTVLVGKAPHLYTQWGHQYLLIGPYLSASSSTWRPDPTRFADWREYFLKKHGYPVYAGSWQIGPHAIPTLLIDFYPAIARKNEIFTELWETYQVDSLFGEWDYIEPAIFGYTAGEVIHSFCEFYYGEVEAIAHFHEWLTGAGVLYLRRHAPHLTTLFTTHATVVGRATGGRLLPPEELPTWLRNHNLTSKHTLERAAWQQADATTTVSEQVSQEAAHYLGHPADILTPNGWDPPTALPIAAAQAWLAELQTRWCQGNPTLWLLHAGRLEPHNKGTYLLLEALRRYRQAPRPKPWLGILFALPSAADKPAGPPTHPLWLTHTLRHPDQDPLWPHLQQLNLSPDEPLRIAYLPVYLEGQDGVLNLPYYALLGAVEASVFPSRYEPWGYTPQESLGLGVPTVSSRQAGFGQWMEAQVRPLPEALTLIDYAAPDPAGQLLRWLYRQIDLASAQRSLLKESARRLAELTRWPTFLPFYREAYTIAQTRARARQRYRRFSPPAQPQTPFTWHRAFFSPTLPPALRPLHTLAYNLYWSWNPDAQRLFARIDPPAWEAHENPVWLLNHLPATTWQRLSQDESFLQEMQQVYQRFERYMAQPLRSDVPAVAYLCMEYGLSRCLPFYAGGLGILAGDYLKEASDAAYPLTAIGLLYRRGYFTQRLSPEGEQIAETPPIRFTDLPLQPVREADGRWLRLRIGLGTQPLYLKVWQVQVGRLSLYLLDADLAENPEELRFITHSLYAGQAELRLQQELVLGLGAQALIEALHLPIQLYHYNEGHPAFHLVAHLAYWRKAGLALPEAIERVRAATLFTTHTPVPAGHDAFSPALLRPYLQPLLEEIGVDWETFLAWGEMPNEPDRFSLTAFCLRFAARTNAVSQLHAQVSRRMFASLYPGYLPAEVPIQGITNGVHLSTWRAPEWSQSRRLWETHQTLKTQLLAYLRRRLSRQPWPVPYLQAVQTFFASTDENTLLLGFARRFAPYKRHWDFIASEDFARLIAEKPVRLIVAGKAHPQDEAGKTALQNLWQKLLQPPYQGKVLFVPDYDMELARWLVQGVDVWVNFPIYGQEASGTSGMKAALNGVLHLSLPDGWWAEVPAEAAGGWTIPVCTVSDPAIRNAWEATQAAFLLQDSILPTYFNRDPRGLPLEWIARMEKAQQYALAHFTASRMLSQYLHTLYLPLAQRLARLTDPTLAQKRQHLLTQLTTHWPHLTVKEVWAPPFAERAHPASEPFSIGVVVDLGPLPPEALRAELVLEKSPQEVITFALSAEAPGRYTGHLRVEDPGVYHWAIRLYAWDPYLEERLWPWTKLL